MALALYSVSHFWKGVITSVSKGERCLYTTIFGFHGVTAPPWAAARACREDIARVAFLTAAIVIRETSPSLQNPPILDSPKQQQNWGQIAVRSEQWAVTLITTVQAQSEILLSISQVGVPVFLSKDRPRLDLQATIVNLLPQTTLTLWEDSFVVELPIASGPHDSSLWEKLTLLAGAYWNNRHWILMGTHLSLSYQNVQKLLLIDFGVSKFQI